MSGIEKMISLATGVRRHFGVLDRLSIDDMITQLNKRCTVPNPNLLEGSATITDKGSTTWPKTINVEVSTGKDPLGNAVVDEAAWCEVMPTLDLSKGTYTFSVNVKAASGSGQRKLGFYVRTSPKQDGITSAENTYEVGSYKRLSWTFTIDNDDKYLMFVTPEGDDNTLLSSFKLERGSVATPWCLASSEVGGGVVKALLTALTPVRGCAA